MHAKDIEYRAAFDTANLELNLIRRAMAKLQIEKEQIEIAVASKAGIAETVTSGSTDLPSSIK